jgi:hypothetical protein
MHHQLLQHLLLLLPLLLLLLLSSNCCNLGCQCRLHLSRIQLLCSSRISSSGSNGHQSCLPRCQSLLVLLAFLLLLGQLTLPPAQPLLGPPQLVKTPFQQLAL